MNSEIPTREPPGEATQARKTTTGVEGLDRILEGGIPQGEIYLVQGEPGTGKTVFGLQFLLAGLQQGEKGLFFSVTQRESDLQDSARSHGWTLDGVHVHQLGQVARRRGSDQVLFQTSQVELVEIMKEVAAVMERERPDRVVFDAIAELRFLANDRARFERQLFALREMFAGKNATVMFVDTQPLTSVGSELEHIAHGVILLEHKPTDFGAQHRRIRVMKMRGMGYREGYHDFRITSGGIVVYPRIHIEDETTNEWRMLESGVPALDRLVGGGLAEGTSCLLVGPSGTGKSSVATLYACAAAARGEAASVLLFEERPDTFVHRSEGLGMPVSRYIEQGLITLTSISTGELTAGEFAEMVRSDVVDRGVRVVIIDSLTGYLSAMPNEHQLLAQMHDLIHYLSGAGVLTILIVAQHGVLGPTLGGPVDISYLADTVLLLRHFEAQGAIRKAISVFKRRYGDHEKTIRELLIKDGSLNVGEPLAGFTGVLTGVPTFTGEPDAFER